MSIGITIGILLLSVFLENMFYPNIIKIELSSHQIKIHYSKYMLTHKVFILDNTEANIMLIPGGRGARNLGMRITDKEKQVDIHTGHTGWSIEKLEEVVAAVNSRKSLLI